MNFPPIPSFDSNTHKSGYVAILGKPNVGKSTLLNQLLGTKLSITTDKPQTTRNRIIGIHSQEDAQLIFLDTPGLIQPKYKLQQAMMREVRKAEAEADVLLFMVDASSPNHPPEAYQQLKALHKPIVLLINKVDTISQERVIDVMEVLNEQLSPVETRAISALNALGTDGLIPLLLKYIPLGPPFYPPEMISEHPERFFVAEIIREKIFLLFDQEIPYSCTVDILSYEEQEEGKDKIEAEIIVNRDSQKGIVIGKGASGIKKIKTLAKRDIERFVDKKVQLNLYVKSRPKWRDKDSFLRNIGFD